MGRRQTAVEISLFPFLSVLCATIGVLVLFIVLVLSTRVVEEEERYQATEEYKRQLKAGREGAVEEGIDASSYQSLEKELERLASVVQERKTRRDALVRELAGLEDLLEFKKTELILPMAPTRRPGLNQPEPVAMIPDQGFQVRLKPVFVEVSSHGYTVQPAGTLYPPLREEQANSGGRRYAADPPLKKFLRETNARRKSEYLVFLIHPNGVRVFDQIRELLAKEHREINIGWEPFSRQWILAEQTQSAPQQQQAREAP